MKPAGGCIELENYMCSRAAGQPQSTDMLLLLCPPGGSGGKGKGRAEVRGRPLRAPLVFARRATPHLSSLAGIAKMPKDKGAAQ
jgi:hypothetical protein